MKIAPFVMACLVLSISASTADGQQRFNGGRQYTVEERDTIRQSLEFSSGGGQKTLDLDGVFGAIHVTGYDGSRIEMTANRTIRADSQDQLRLAKDRVKLDLSDKADTVGIYVDQPGHQRSNPSSRNFNRSDPGYEVEFDFELRVPRATAVHLGNVSGDIRVEDITGDFDVNAINGRIEMTKVAGSGRVHTINGPVDVKFASNPSKDSYFGSLNGVVDVTFQRNLSADLKFKTFNAGVYTDFTVTALPTALNAPQRRNGMFVFKNEYQGARVGQGGPMLEFDGFNQDILIRQAK
jgi:hypothetical protein